MTSFAGLRWSAGVLAVSLVALVALPPGAVAAFGFESVTSVFTVAGGATGSLAAGEHPESWTTALSFNSGGPPDERYAEGFVKDLRVDLPVGLIAAPGLLPHCSRNAFLEEECPALTAVGSVDFAAVEALSSSTVFLLEAPSGQAAELGFHAAKIPVLIDIALASVPPYGLTASITNISQVTELFGATLRLEGTPNGAPFLLLPRSCADSLKTSFTASSWEDPATAVGATAPEAQSVTGCVTLAYSPTLELTPTTTATASPSGLDVRMDAPDPGLADPTGRAAADTRSATLVLPEGLTINPPVADGLSVCTPAELAAEEFDSLPGEGCPESSKLGSATVTTPLFEESIKGAIYLVRPEGASSAIVSSHSGSAIMLQLVLRDAERGILLMLPLSLDADAQSGRLTTSIEDIPELPISQVQLHFDSGPHAALVTPDNCGSHSIDYSLIPSSGNPPLTGSQAFSTVSSDCSPAFAPSLGAGMTSTGAGQSAVFVFELSQDAGAPNATAFSVTLPAGLSAAFGTVASCGDGQTATGECPAASKLGYARIAVGSGPEPLWVPPGEEPDSAVYLAGPYKGAPYSLVIVVPGQAGPFDLGTVVLRAPITIDPATAQASLSVEDLPQILDGVPLRYRAIRVVLDRPGFIRNPTSCEPTAITGVARAVGGSSAAISTRFQAADCAALRFKPRLALRLSGALGRNGHPALRAVLRTDPDGAALDSARFALPAGELLDLRHVRRLCPRAVAVGACPPAARLGSLRLYSPSLEAPLQGPVYLRAPRHRLPDLVAEVRSGDLRFLLHGRTTATKRGLGVALEALPDIPLSRAILNLAGGRRGILVNSHSLCGRRGYARASFGAHNGRTRHLGVRVKVDGCRRAR